MAFVMLERRPVGPFKKNSLLLLQNTIYYSIDTPLNIRKLMFTARL